jgi:hypothetical protein
MERRNEFERSKDRERDGSKESFRDRESRFTKDDKIGELNRERRESEHEHYR